MDVKKRSGQQSVVTQMKQKSAILSTPGWPDGQDYAIASQKSDPYFSIRNMWQELSFGHFVGLLLVS